MKKHLLIHSFCLLLISAIALTFIVVSNQTDGYIYNPKVYRNVVYSGLGLHEPTFWDFSTTETEIRTRLDGLIAVCEVAGPSINKADVPSDGYYVLTPIRILQILYKGDEVELEAGDIEYLREPYFYVTEDTVGWVDYYDLNTLGITYGGYVPMEMGKTYLLYSAYNPDRADYNGNHTLGTCTEWVYSLDGAADTHPGDKPYDYYIYAGLWYEVMSAYGSEIGLDMTDATPPPTYTPPTPEPTPEPTPKPPEEMTRSEQIEAGLLSARHPRLRLSDVALLLQAEKRDSID
ncbi:MAG: hypothetical protein LBT60_03010, partial [Oscillospiraceae bacterium]|nr:hypothetical protein [Oscillospiraceae bacterium]